MHEVSLAMEIIEMARTVALQHNASKVKTVHIAVGKLAGVEVDALQFALESMRMDEMFRETEYDIYIVSASGKCFHCQKIQHVEAFGETCKNCGSFLRLIDGTSLQLTSIEI